MRRSHSPHPCGSPALRHLLQHCPTSRIHAVVSRTLPRIPALAALGYPAHRREKGTKPSPAGGGVRAPLSGCAPWTAVRQNGDPGSGAGIARPSSIVAVVYRLRRCISVPAALGCRAHRNATRVESLSLRKRRAGERACTGVTAPAIPPGTKVPIRLNLIRQGSSWSPRHDRRRARPFPRRPA